MGSAGRGAKAGLAAGVVMGVLTAVVAYLTVSAMKAEIIVAIERSLPAGAPITAEQAYLLAAAIGPVVAASVGIIIGLILGAIFGWVYERVPGGTSRAKGVFFSLVVFIIMTLIGLGNLSYGAAFFTVNVMTNLMLALIYGFLLGAFYDRFGRVSKPV